MRPRFRPIAVVIVAVGMAAVLTSCVPATGRPAATPADSAPETETPRAAGLTREAAAELLDAVPGLGASAVGSQISGLATEAVMEVSVEDEAAILGEGVLDYVLRVGWATELPDRPTQLSLTVWKGNTRLDLQEQANDIAGFEYRAIPLRYSVHLDEPEYLGAWPGPVPTPPSG